MGSSITEIKSTYSVCAASTLFARRAGWAGACGFLLFASGCGTLVREVPTVSPPSVSAPPAGISPSRVYTAEELDATGLPNTGDALKRRLPDGR